MRRKLLKLGVPQRDPDGQGRNRSQSKRATHLRDAKVQSCGRNALCYKPACPLLGTADS